MEPFWLLRYRSFQPGEEFNWRSFPGFNHQFCSFQDRFVACQVNFISSTAMHYFTVTCLVAWALNESEAGGDLVLIETSLLFSC